MSIAPRIRPSSTWSRGSKPSAAKSRGVPSSREHHVVVLAARGRLVVGRVGDRRRSPRASRRSAAVCAASAVLTSAARVLVRASRSAFSSPCRLRDQLAELLLLRAQALEVGDRRRAGRSSALERPSTTSPDSPRFAWAARTRSGSSRSSRGSITWRGYRGVATGYRLRAPGARTWSSALGATTSPLGLP